MRVAVIGLGYVGTTTAACLAARGHEILGVDVNAVKAEMIGRGESPVIEDGIAERLTAAVGQGRLRATTSAARVAAETDVSLVCVGTPSRPNGSLDLDHLVHAVETVGRSLGGSDRYHVVAIRSTMLPGTVDGILIPALERTSGRRAGHDFGVCANPEFLREGDAVRDFEDPPFTLIGEIDSRSGSVLEGVYEGLGAPVIRTDVGVAEAVKYVSNAYHALKISFANEVGLLLKVMGVDPFAVLDIFKQDRRLNISDAYLRPGYAFGGSCLPKDLRATLYAAKTNDLDLPVLSAVLPGNEAHVRRGIDAVVRTGRRKVGVLGFSFKAGTDDLRESPLVALVEALLGKGYDLEIYDRHVSLARLVGANKEYIESVIPHIATLMNDDLDAVLDHAEVVVIGNADPSFASVAERLRDDQVVVDLVGTARGRGELGDRYEGIAW
jgi:GDP-mannose 6-dehydrogenase